MNNSIEIKLIKSLIGQHKKTKLIAKALGLKKINQVVIKVNNSCILGMLNKITHLIKFKHV